MFSAIRYFHYDPTDSERRLRIGIPEEWLQEDWCYYEIEEMAKDIALRRLREYGHFSRETVIGEDSERWTRKFTQVLEQMGVPEEKKENAENRFEEIHVKKSKYFRTIRSIIILGHFEGKAVELNGEPVTSDDKAVELGAKKVRLNRKKIHLPDQCFNVFGKLIDALPSLEIEEVPKEQDSYFF